MRSRGCLIVLAAAALVIIAGVVLVRRALSPDAFRGVAEEQLAAALGQPVRIGTFDISVLPQPLVTGGDIVVGDGRTDAAPALTIHEVRIVPDVASLLGGTVDVRRIELVQLALSIRRDAEGRWHFPFAMGDAGGAEPGAASVKIADVQLREGVIRIIDDVLRSPGGSAEVVVIDRIAARLVDTGQARRLEGLTAAIGGSTINGSGSIGGDGFALQLAWQSLSTGDLPAVFALAAAAPPAGLRVEGEQPLALDLRVSPAGALSATGKLAASTVALDTLTVSEVTAPLRFDGRVLALDPVALRAYGGSTRGTFTADLGASPAAWRLQAAVSGVDVDAFLSANTSLRNKIEGTGNLRTDLRGKAGEPLDRSLAGTIHLTLTKGVIRDFPLLSTLNQALRVASTADGDTAFDSLSGTLTAAGGRLRTDDLRLVSGDTTVRMTGTLTFAQHLELQGVAAISEQRSRELSAQWSDLSAQKNDRGEIELPFSVSGTTSQPHVAVRMDRMIERAAEKEIKRQLRRGLDRLIK
jgi:uncharacterized protein involved in outer membrane biogenesis